jgi:hypothetical protein
MNREILSIQRKSCIPMGDRGWALCKWSPEHELELFMEISNDLIKQTLHFREDAKEMSTKIDISTS